MRRHLGSRRAQIAVLLANGLLLTSTSLQARPLSDDEFQARLDALQSQINDLKTERARTHPGSRYAHRRPGTEIAAYETDPETPRLSVAPARAFEPQGGVERQQESIERRVNKLSNANVNQPSLDNPTYRISTSGGSVANVLTLPSDITVSLHGTFAVFGASESSSANNVNGNKLNPITSDAYAVLAPAVNFQASNDLSYGVKSTLWITQTAAGTGSNENGTTLIGTTPQSTPSFIVHYLYGYAQSERFGTWGIGQIPGTFTSMEIGNPDLDAGGWDALFRGGLPNVVPAAVRPFNLHGTTNAIDSTLKISYISAPFYGFSVGASFEPNSDGTKEGSFTCGVAGSTCASLLDSTTLSDLGRKRVNTFDASVRYHHEFGDYTFNASAGILHGEPIHYTGAPTTTNTNYKPLEVGRAGAEFGGPLGPGRFLVNGQIQFGQTEDLYAFQPVGASNAFMYIFGATYLVDHWKFAAAYFREQTAGLYDPGVTGVHEIETGPQAEIAYKLTPHWKVLGSYLYGTRQQQGYDFILGAVGPNHNYVWTSTFGLGTQFDF